MEYLLCDLSYTILNESEAKLVRVNLKEMINITVQTAMCLIEMIERNKQLVIDKFNGANRMMKPENYLGMILGS